MHWNCSIGSLTILGCILSHVENWGRLGWVIDNEVVYVIVVNNVCDVAAASHALLFNNTTAISTQPSLGPSSLCPSKLESSPLIIRLVSHQRIIGQILFAIAPSRIVPASPIGLPHLSFYALAIHEIVWSFPIVTVAAWWSRICSLVIAETDLFVRAQHSCDSSLRAPYMTALLRRTSFSNLRLLLFKFAVRHNSATLSILWIQILCFWRISRFWRVLNFWDHRVRLIPKVVIGAAKDVPVRIFLVEEVFWGCRRSFNLPLSLILSFLVILGVTCRSDWICHSCCFSFLSLLGVRIWAALTYLFANLESGASSSRISIRLIVGSFSFNWIWTLRRCGFFFYMLRILGWILVQRGIFLGVRSSISRQHKGIFAKFSEVFKTSELVLV